jgi:hypothetical protein
VISTQEPTVVPEKFIDLCSFVIAHRFSSPTWLKHLLAHISASEDSSKELWDKVCQHTEPCHYISTHDLADPLAEHRPRNLVLSKRPVRQVLGREARIASLHTGSRLSHRAVAVAGHPRWRAFAPGRPGRSTRYTAWSCACSCSDCFCPSSASQAHRYARRCSRSSRDSAERHSEEHLRLGGQRYPPSG